MRTGAGRHGLVSFTAHFLAIRNQLFTLESYAITTAGLEAL
jgi:hypothetical protein